AGLAEGARVRRARSVLPRRVVGSDRDAFASRRRLADPLDPVEPGLAGMTLFARRIDCSLLLWPYRPGRPPPERVCTTIGALGTTRVRNLTNRQLVLLRAILRASDMGDVVILPGSARVA